MSMTDKAKHLSLLSVATPAALLLAEVLAFAWQAEVLKPTPTDALLFVPETVTIEPRTFKYRADGEYSK